MTRGHSLLGKYHCTAGLQSCKVFIQLLHCVQKHIMLLLKFSLVKVATSNTVSLPPTVSVLCYESYFFTQALGKEDSTISRFVSLSQIFWNETVSESTRIRTRKFRRIRGLHEQHDTFGTRVRVPDKMSTETA